jgi:hypothetical protein
LIAATVSITALVIETSASASDGGVRAARSVTDEPNESNESVDFPALAAAVGAVIIVLALLAPVIVGKRRRTRAPATASTRVASTDPVPAEPSSREVIDLTASGPHAPLAGYPLTALCSDAEVVELRAAVEPSGIVVSQAQTIDEAMRDVVSGRARALYLDGARAEARLLAAAVRQRNNAGWSACPTFVYVPPRTVPDPAIIALADVVVTAPLDASRVVATLANHAPVIARSSR